MLAPQIQRQTLATGKTLVVLSGDWTLAAMGQHYHSLREDLQKMVQGAAGEVAWDLSATHRLDSAGALLIWRAWGERRPASLVVDAETDRALSRVELAPERPDPNREWHLEALMEVGRRWLSALQIALGMVTLTGQVLLDTLHVLRHPRDLPWREFSAALHRTAVTALPITGLLGFLVGSVMSYLMALQLKTFGANTLIVNVLGYGVFREFGPVLMAVLVAGRSGSAITAQLGLMRVNEELDALATMGISRSLRLVTPKVAALTVAGPLLTLWTSAAALAGGWMAAYWQLDIDLDYFLGQLPGVVPIGTAIIGLAKGAVFCGLIGIVASYFGTTVKPNTESLSARTTLSVVVSITVVILADAVLAVATRGIGAPF